MSAKKQSGDDGAGFFGGDASRRGRRMLLASAIVTLLLAGAGYAIWRHVRDHVLSGAQYQVHAEHIEITPPPAWIRGNGAAGDPADRVKAEVLRDASRSSPLSLLDADLTVRMAGAFAAHPWVARVERVSKHFPSRLEVVLVYRTPAAMVEVQDGTGVLPVDEEGVVLPSRDFTAEDAEHYPRIGEIHTMPAGAVGTRWGDAAVHGGAQIAATLADDWHKLGMARIVPVERKAARIGFEYTYALLTHSGTRIDWGRAPGTDLPGEVPARDKIAQLKRYAAANDGALDGPGGPQEIEIDASGALLRKAPPAIAPLPSTDET